MPLLRRGVFKSVPELIAAIDEFILVNNKNPKPFVGPKRPKTSWKRSAIVKPLLRHYTVLQYKILEAYLKAKGVKDADILINYTPFGHSDWQSIVAEIKKFGSAGTKTGVVSTINGDANVPFYKELGNQELGNQKVSAEDIPVVAFSVGEEELSVSTRSLWSATSPPGITS